MANYKYGKKGFSLITLTFIILAIALGGVLWYHTSVLSGTGIVKEISEEMKFLRTDRELKNSILYLEMVLKDSATNSSQTTSDLGGRHQNDSKYRYWQCDKNEVWNSGREIIKEIPSLERVLMSLQNFTMKYFYDRLLELHGVRDNVIYDIGDLECAEVGYNNPRESVNNSYYRTSAIISHVSTTFNNFKREVENLELLQEVKYNRFWYMYEKLYKWANWIIDQELFRKNIEKELATVPDYVQDYFCAVQCPCRYRTDCRPEIPLNWSNFVGEATHTGIKETVKTLELPEYFDDTEVKCGYEVGQNYYRAQPIEDNARNGCCAWSGGVCVAWWWRCRLWYDYSVETDVDVVCTDRKYKSIPREDLEMLTWRARFNVEAHDPPNEGRYPPPCHKLDPPCLTEHGNPAERGEKNFPNCEIGPENITMCKTNLTTVGNLTLD